MINAIAIGFVVFLVICIPIGWVLGSILVLFDKKYRAVERKKKAAEAFARKKCAEFDKEYQAIQREKRAAEALARKEYASLVKNAPNPQRYGELVRGLEDTLSALDRNAKLKDIRVSCRLREELEAEALRQAWETEKERIAEQEEQERIAARSTQYQQADSAILWGVAIGGVAGIFAGICTHSLLTKGYDFVTLVFAVALWGVVIFCGVAIYNSVVFILDECARKSSSSSAPPSAAPS